MAKTPPPPSRTTPPEPIFEPDVQVTSTAPGRTTNEGTARVFPCEECGADLVYNIGAGAMKCPYCGHVKVVELAADAEVREQDYADMLVRLSEKRDKGEHQEVGQKELHCDACGGTVVFTGTLTSSECPYCATPIQRDDVHQAKHRIPVDAVLPFTVDHHKAQTNLTEWVKSLWFAPNDFREAGVKGKFNGVYLPYWTFDSLTFTVYTGQRGEHYTVTVGSGKDQRTETRTRWYPASGRFERFFDDVLVVASQGLPADLILALEPWPLGKCIPFSQEVLAGFLARTYDTELPAGFSDAKARIEQALEQDVRQRIGGDEQRIDSMNCRHNGVSFKHLLLPVWMLAYRYHDKLYQVFVNAATGEVQGERPWSWIKITFAVLLGLIAVGAIFALTQK